jgi:hypothetical protein
MMQKSSNNTNYIPDDLSHLTLEEIDDAIGIVDLLAKTKCAIKERLKHSFMHLRDDKNLLKIINHTAPVYFEKYKKMMESQRPLFGEYSNMTLKYKYPDLLHDIEIKNEKEFALFMFKMLKFYIDRIDNNPLRDHSEADWYVDAVIDDLFLSVITNDDISKMGV